MSRTPILYDADCGLCRAGMALVLVWDRRGRLRPVALQSPEAERLLEGMPVERRMNSWHLITPAREVHSASAAFVPLLRVLPGGGPLAALSERFPRVAERGYRLIADNRSALGRRIPRGLKQRADALIKHRA